MIIFKESWIQHATVKENILFGKEFDRSEYKAVLKACALEEVQECYAVCSRRNTTPTKCV